MRAEFQRRPAIALAVGLCIGLTTPFAPWNLALLLVYLVWIQDASCRLAASLACALGALLSPAPVAGIAKSVGFHGEVQVVSVPRLYADRAVCEVVYGGSRFALYTLGRETPMLGDRLSVSGKLSPLSEFSDDYWLGRSVIGVLRPNENGWAVLRQGGPLSRVGSTWRSSFVDWSRAAFTQTSASMVDALCFNLDSFLDPEIKRGLARSGALHIVSASGLHVMIVAGALLAIGSFVPVPRPALLIFAILFLTAYAFATGLRPPVVRSVIMAAMFLCAYLCQREPDGLSALCIAAVACLVVNPAWLFDVGFQLSYVAIAALVLFAGVRKPLPSTPVRRFGALIYESLRISLIASLASAPLLAYHFGQVSLISMFSNLLISIALPVVVVGSMGAHLLGLVVPMVSFALAGSILEPLVRWIMLVGTEGGSLSFAAVSTPGFSGYWIVAAYGLALCAWRPVARRA